MPDGGGDSGVGRALSFSVGGRFSLWPKGRTWARVSPALFGLILFAVAVIASNSTESGGEKRATLLRGLGTGAFERFGSTVEEARNRDIAAASKELDRAPSSPIQGVPIPAGARSLTKRNIMGISALEYEINSSPARIGAFYLDEVGRDWILVDSDVMTEFGQGWTGAFLSKDFKRKLYIFALPREIAPRAAAGGPSGVSLMLIPAREGGELGGRS